MIIDGHAFLSNEHVLKKHQEMNRFIKGIYFPSHFFIIVGGSTHNQALHWLTILNSVQLTKLDDKTIDTVCALIGV